MAIAANGSRSAVEKPGRRLRIPLWLKFATVIAALVALLLLASGAISLWWGYNEAQRSALSGQQQKAEALAGRIGGVMTELESQLAWTAQPAWKSAGVEQQRADFTRMLSQFPAITELFFIDSNGIERLKVSRFAPDSIASQTNHATEPRFVETVKSRTWFGPVYVRNGAELASTVGVVHADGGASVAEIDLAFVADLVNAAKQGDSYAFVVDKAGRLIAYPGRNAVTGDTDMSGLPQVKAALAAGGTGTTADAIADGQTPALAAHAEALRLGWTVLSQTPQAGALAPFYTLAWQSALLLGTGLLIALAVGVWLARRVAAPIGRLRLSAERLGEGDLTQRVAVRRRDEIGALAEKFNTMASLLQQSHKGLESRIDDRAVGLDIAQQQQAMTAEMLKTIGRADYELESVLDTLIGSAVRLAEANVGAVWLREGDAFRLATQLGHTGEWIEAARQTPFAEGSHTHAVAAAAAYSGQTINVDDVARDLRFMGDYGERPANSDERAALAVPLTHAGIVEAVFSLSRADPIPFSERQVAVTLDFADQALIAIRNMRLLEKVEARDSQLRQSFEQQTATGDILRVISQSPSNIQPVLDTIVESAARLCNARYCYVDLFDGTLLHFKAHYGLPPEAIELIGRTFPMEPGRGTAAARAVATGAVAEIPDMQADAEYEMGALSGMLGSRSTVAAPLLKNGAPIGVITIERLEAGTLPERQIELLKTFAEQAVIAIANFRMFEEIQARNRDVTEALEQQTATADVLKTISSSAFDLDAVLHTLVKSASDLCRSGMGYIYLRQGDVLQPTVQIGWSQEFQDHMNNLPVTPGRGSIAARVAQSGSVEQIADVLDDPEYTNIEGQRLGGFRTLLGVPLLRDGAVNGVFVLARTTVSPFSAREIELVQTFSDQAVIAIENVRLFEEAQARTADLGESLQQQTATADVLKVISASAFDLDAVLDTLIRSAIPLCEATRGVIWLRTGDELFLAAHVNYPDEWVEFAQGLAITPAADAATTSGLAAFTGEVVNVEDVLNDPRFRSLAGHKLGDYRGGLAVPLKRDGKVEGVIALSRPEARLFTERQVALVQTFADQAVIAIENVRLFDEVQARTAELGEALQQQTATADVLKVISASAFDLDSVLQTLIDSAAGLCGASTSGIYMLDGDVYRIFADYGMPAEFRVFEDAHPNPADRQSWVGRAAFEKAVIHVPDVLKDVEHALPDAPRLGRFAAILCVPLMREGQPIGVFALTRPEPGLFSQRQIELVQTFADQAVIAIENVRLFKEVQARTAEVSEALQQQTATGEVLRVIASSPADIQPVLDAVVESATRLCDAFDAVVMLRQDGVLLNAAHYGPMLADIPSFPVDRDTASGRAVVDRTAIHVHDITVEDKEYPAGRQMALRLGHRTALATPLLRDGEAIGVVLLRRNEVRPFSDKQIQLLKTFADQAVIAIENARLFDEVQARTADVSEALTFQKAASDVLEVIGRSASNRQPVFDAMVETAADLCRADMAVLRLLKEGELHHVASSGGEDSLVAAHSRRHPILPTDPSSVAGRVALEGRTVHIDDVGADPQYGYLKSLGEAPVHTVLGVPLMQDGKLAGVFVLLRSVVDPFSQRQIELVETFAGQAVIAIENARLFDEVQARTADVSEALRQQTATADVLKVISRSAFDLQTVLDTLNESAVRLCRADKGCLERIIDGRFEYAAITGFPSGFREYGVAHQTEPGRGSAVGRAAEERRVIQIEDVTVDPEYAHSAIAAVGGMRTVLAVPLLREGELLGTFAMIRTEVQPFSQREIELVQTFADQAVIAIENVRLFDEVQARTAEVTEALDQQTATGAILQVIAGSPTDIQPVLDAVAESAARLCEAYDATIYLLRSDRLVVGAHHGPIPIDDAGLPLSRDVVTGRAVLDRVPVHVHDLTAAGEEFATGRMMANRLGFRAILATPLLQEGNAIGAIMIRRAEARAFGDNQIDLLKTFANQAVIAIGNVRLFEEVQARTAEVSEALRQQTATADVLKAISRSTFDLPAVLDTLVTSAATLCGATYGGIFLRDGNVLRGRATISERPTDWDIDHPIEIDRRWISGRVALSGRIEHIPDVLEDSEYDLEAFRRITDTRALMGVPLLREGKVEGVFYLGRPDPGAFTARQSELVQTFADQAVIAIENSRLFGQVKARTEELSRSIEELQTAQGRLVQTEKLASLGQLTAGIAHEIKNPLNFVNNFSLLSNELVDEIRMVLEAAVIDGETRAEVEELGDTLKANLDKVVWHGKRADSIVRNMLLHSREGSGEHRPVDINQVVDESLGLAYHGKRAEQKDFNITLEKTLDPTAGVVDLYPQEITRVLLNLIANGFYATEKRSAESNGSGYQPVLAASTKNLGNAVEIKIRDNGTGIPADVKAKMFNPFFTTKPAGEGTGLGLSLSHDIIVKQHSGTIDVETVPGSFTEFRIVLPRSGASMAEQEGSA